jgi:mono/diheme cytochrome c family protein
MAGAHKRGRYPWVAVIAICLGCPLAFVTAAAQRADKPSTRDGIFSPQQVERGRESFLWECTDCHEMEEFTGVGAYLEQMEGETVWDVFEFIWSEMPEDRPARLEPEEYADILSYILSVYGLPTGERDMPIDSGALRAIAIERPERPGS